MILEVSRPIVTARRTLAKAAYPFLLHLLKRSDEAVEK